MASDPGDSLSLPPTHSPLPASAPDNNEPPHPRHPIQPHARRTDSESTHEAQQDDLAATLPQMTGAGTQTVVDELPLDPPLPDIDLAPEETIEVVEEVKKRLQECSDLKEFESLFEELRTECEEFDNFIEVSEPELSSWPWASILETVDRFFRFTSDNIRIYRSLVDVAAKPERANTNRTYVPVGVNHKPKYISKVSLEDLNLKSVYNSTANIMLFLLSTHLKRQEDVVAALASPEISRYIAKADNQFPRPNLANVRAMVDQFVAALPALPPSQTPKLNLYDQILSVHLLHLFNCGKSHLDNDGRIVYNGGHPAISNGEKQTCIRFYNEAVYAALKDLVRLFTSELPETAQNPLAVERKPFVGPHRVALLFTSGEPCLRLPRWHGDCNRRRIGAHSNMVPLPNTSIPDRSSRTIGFWNTFDEDFTDWDLGIERYAASDGRTVEEKEILAREKPRILTAMAFLDEQFKNKAPPYSARKGDGWNNKAWNDFCIRYPRREHARSGKGFYAHRNPRATATAELRVGRKLYEENSRLIDKIPSVAFASILGHVGNKLFESIDYPQGSSNGFKIRRCALLLAKLAQGSIQFKVNSKPVQDCMNCEGELSEENLLSVGNVGRDQIYICTDCIESLEAARTPDGEGMGESLSVRYASALRHERQYSREQIVNLVEAFLLCKKITEETIHLTEEHLGIGQVSNTSGGSVVPITSSPDNVGKFPNAEGSAFLGHIPENIAVTSFPINLRRGNDPAQSVPLVALIFALRTVESAIVESGRGTELLQAIRDGLTLLITTAGKVHKYGKWLSKRGQPRDVLGEEPHKTFLAKVAIIDQTLQDAVRFPDLTKQVGTEEFYRNEHDYFQDVPRSEVLETIEELLAIREGRHKKNLSDEYLLEKYNIPESEWNRVKELVKDIPSQLKPEDPSSVAVAYCSDDSDWMSFLSPAETQANGEWTVSKNKVLLLRVVLKCVDYCDRNHAEDDNAENAEYRWGNLMVHFYWLVVKQEWLDPFCGRLRLANQDQGDADLGGFGHVTPFMPMLTGILVPRPSQWSEIVPENGNVIFRCFHPTRCWCFSLQIMMDDDENRAKQAASKMDADYARKLLKEHRLVGASDAEQDAIAAYIDELNGEDSFRWDRILIKHGYLTKQGREVPKTLFGQSSKSAWYGYEQLVRTE